jgi:Ca2+-binding EF-hand superfamily protein
MSHLFNKFDLDGDGRISYADFQNSVGRELYPKEFFYFR